MYIPSATPKGPRAQRGQGIPFKAQRFCQGPRVAYNVAFPLTALSQFVDIDKIGAVDNDINREIKKQHVQSCEQYVEVEQEFVLGGLVLAADAAHVAFKAEEEETGKKIEEYDRKYQEACDSNDPATREALAAELDQLNDNIPVCSGTLWMPYGVRLEVTDGQHRIKTILNKIADGNARLTLQSQGIPAMVIIEPRRQKRQQDFVDLGQTEAIKPTIKILMDYRQPVTKLVKEMVEEVPIFHEQFIEFRRPSIRKASGNLYSLANLKIAVQAMLLGNTRLGAAEAQRKLTEKLGGANYDALRDKVVDFFSRLSQEVFPFKQILDDPDTISYPKVREEFMCLNSVGLATMGMVGHDVILGRIPLEDAVIGISKVDWSRANDLWEGTLRVGPGIARGGNVIELGASIVKVAGGLPLKQRDLDRIKGVEGLSAKLPAGWESRVVSGLIEPEAVESPDITDANAPAQESEDAEVMESVLA